jgi:hypothetical protein
MGRNYLAHPARVSLGHSTGDPAVSNVLIPDTLLLSECSSDMLYLAVIQIARRFCSHREAPAAPAPGPFTCALKACRVG